MLVEDAMTGGGGDDFLYDNDGPSSSGPYRSNSGNSATGGGGSGGGAAGYRPGGATGSPARYGAAVGTSSGTSGSGLGRSKPTGETASLWDALITEAQRYSEAYDSAEAGLDGDDDDDEEDELGVMLTGSQAFAAQRSASSFASKRSGLAGTSPSSSSSSSPSAAAGVSGGAALPGSAHASASGRASPSPHTGPVALTSWQQANIAKLRDFLDHLATTVEEQEPPAAAAASPAAAGSAGSGSGSAGHHHHRGAKQVLPVRDAVWLGTVHQAKGLQWRAVFVVRMIEGTMPMLSEAEMYDRDAYASPMAGILGGGGTGASPLRHQLQAQTARRGFGKNAAINPEEERRICYVAMSRAEEYLHLSYPTIVEKQPVSRSRFISDVPERLRKHLFVYDPRQAPNDVDPTVVGVGPSPSRPLGSAGTGTGMGMGAVAMVGGYGVISLGEAIDRMFPEFAGTHGGHQHAVGSGHAHGPAHGHHGATPAGGGGGSGAGMAINRQLSFGGLAAAQAGERTGSGTGSGRGSVTGWDRYLANPHKS